MPVSVYERRKFVRIDMNLGARLNHRVQAAVKTLSLGGCLVECNELLDLSQPIEIAFTLQDTIFRLFGRVIHVKGENQYGVRFEVEDEQTVRLVGVIQKIQNTQPSRRPTRIKVRQEAFLDNEPSLLTNLSEGGGFLLTSQLFNRGDIVEVKFLLNQEEIYLAGQVRWNNGDGIGVEFLSPDPSQVDDIIRFISLQES